MLSSKKLSLCILHRNLSDKVYHSISVVQLRRLYLLEVAASCTCLFANKLVRAEFSNFVQMQPTLLKRNNISSRCFTLKLFSRHSFFFCTIQALIPSIWLICFSSQIAYSPLGTTERIISSTNEVGLGSSPSMSPYSSVSTLQRHILGRCHTLDRLVSMCHKNENSSLSVETTSRLDGSFPVLSYIRDRWSSVGSNWIGWYTLVGWHGLSGITISKQFFQLVIVLFCSTCRPAEGPLLMRTRLVAHHQKTRPDVNDDDDDDGATGSCDSIRPARQILRAKSSLLAD